MKELRLFDAAEKSPIVLCLGAHCDDIEIGCGSTLLRLVREKPSLTLVCIVFSSNESREAETRESIRRFAGTNTSLDLRFFRNRDGYLPYIGGEVKEQFEGLKAEIGNPDLIFTHDGEDLHQDHRMISELTWNTFRDHLILEYEIPKYDGGLGSPNVFIPASKRDRDAKINTLLDCYATQSEKGWFTRSTFDSLMRLRGIECHAKSGYAEAFYARKIVL